VISQVLAIPPRRRERAIVSYLTPEEADALVAAPDRTTWHGRRDRALLLLAVQAGLRVSELTGLARQDTHLGAGPHVRCHGKGRKDRATPLTGQTVKVLRTWLAVLGPAPAGPLFPTRSGGRMSRDAVEKLVAKHAATAADGCPSVKEKTATIDAFRAPYAGESLTAALQALHRFHSLRPDFERLGTPSPAPGGTAE
jgi:integrase